MSSISKRLSLRVPANVIYRGLKDTRLEQLFLEFFTGASRKLTINDKANSELQFTMTTYDSQIQIKEIFKLKVLRSNATEITYTTALQIRHCIYNHRFDGAMASISISLILWMQKCSTGGNTAFTFAML